MEERGFEVTMITSACPENGYPSYFVGSVVGFWSRSFRICVLKVVLAPS